MQSIKQNDAIQVIQWLQLQLQSHAKEPEQETQQLN